MTRSRSSARAEGRRRAVADDTRRSRTPRHRADDPRGRSDTPPDRQDVSSHQEPPAATRAERRSRREEPRRVERRADRAGGTRGRSRPSRTARGPRGATRGASTATTRREAQRVRRPGRRRARVVVVALVLALGGATWAWAARTGPPEPSVAAPPASVSTPSGDAADVRPVASPEADARVVQDLVVLRAQAVVLAETLDGEDPQVAALAADLRDGSDPELTALVDWLRAAGYEVPAEAEDPGSTDLDAHPDLPGGFSTSQLGWLERARVDNADRLFLGLLMAQDQGVVSLLEQHAEHTGDEGLRTMAAAMARTRTERIERVSAMLERLT